MSANNTTRANAHRTPPQRGTLSYKEKVAYQEPNPEPATPSKVLRVEGKPILCFQQVTNISTRTMLRVEPPQFRLESRVKNSVSRHTGSQLRPQAQPWRNRTIHATSNF
jgi:hypothetical protein